MKRLLLLALIVCFCNAPLAASAGRLVGDARVQPGDTLSIEVANDPALSKSVVVMNDGAVIYPVLGRLLVGDRTLPQIEALFLERLRPYERHPDVSISIAQTGLWDVTVLGNVKNPGKYQLRSGAHVADALAAAGGLGPTDGALPDARVMDRSGNLQTVSMQSLLREGNPTADAGLTNGATLYVPSAATIDVSVLGAVDHAGQVELHAGDRLSMAVAKAGESTSAKSDLSHVFLTRELVGGVKQTYNINLYQALQNNDPRFDVPMQKGDVVFVPETSQKNGFLWGGMVLLRRLLFGY